MPNRHPKRNEAIALLNEAGWSDPDIGNALGLATKSIFRARKRMGIPGAKTKYGLKIDDAVALELYNSGCSDGQIAKHFGAHQTGARFWRIKRGLKPHHNGITPIPESEVKGIKKLLRAGASKAKVREHFTVCKGTLRKIRASMPSAGLRRTGLTDRAIRASLKKDHNILARLERAIGMHVPEHIREHAVYDMYGDLFECVLSIDDIEKRAPSYRNAAYKMCGSEWGVTRLDKPDHNGLLPIDTLADESGDINGAW